MVSNVSNIYELALPSNIYELALPSNIWHSLLLWWSSKPRHFEFIKTTSIVSNLVFSGVLRGAEGKYV